MGEWVNRYRYIDEWVKRKTDRQRQTDRQADMGVGVGVLARQTNTSIITPSGFW